MKTLLLFSIVTTLGMFSIAQTDLCTGAPSLTVNASCTTVPYSVPTTFADNFASEPSCGVSYVDGFFQFTATGAATTVTITDGVTNPNPGLMILSGPCGGPYTILGCSQNANGSNETVTVPTTSGTVYWAVIFSVNNAGTAAPTANTTGTICAFTPPAGSICETGTPLTIGATVCGTNSNVGSFPDAGGAPTNGCDSFYNDGEYWYTVTGTGAPLSIAMTGLSASFSGVFVYSGCPASGGTCIAFAEGSGTANYTATTPVLTNGVTYYIVVANWSTPYQTNFCITATVATPPVIAPDCSSYVNVCSNTGFQIDPNGFGTINEIPTPGSFGNPYYGGFDPPNPWGTSNWGCLRIGESNSTWMVVNISGTGNLEFSFGAGGAQTGYYDWIMYPYTGASTCTAITGNTLAPVRCNWNGVNFGGTGLASTPPAGGDPSNYEPPLAVTAGQQYIICFSNYSSASTNVPLNFFGTATVSCTPLGLDLHDFDIDMQCATNEVKLSWKLPVDQEVDHFTVERSIDGNIWEMVAEVKTPSETEGSDNLFTSRAELNGASLNYFRIMEVDKNGETDYSVIKTAICKEQIRLNTLAPNPADGLTNLTYMSKMEGSLVILDQSGRKVKTLALENTQGKIIFLPIEVSDLQKGSYLFVVNNGESRTTIPFVKM